MDTQPALALRLIMSARRGTTASKVRTSIGRRVFVLLALVCAFLVALGFATIAQIGAIEDLSATLGDVYSPQTRDLVQISGLLGRVQHSHEMLELDLASRPNRGEIQFENHSQVQLSNSVASLSSLKLPRSERAEVTHFETTLHDYLASLKHGRRDHIAVQSPARGGTDITDSLYESALKALALLRKTSHAELLKDVRQSKLTANWSIAVLVVVAAIGGLVLVWEIADVRRKVIKPVEAITSALSRLANGETDNSVPGLDREDEIGALARAFEVFRQKLDALERTHAQLKRARKRAQIIANRDALTKLPNRRAFIADMNAAVQRSRDGISRCAVMIVDLDRFKPLNDIYGHTQGDAVLKQVAQCLGRVACKGCLVARLGGDEFAVLLETRNARVNLEEWATDFSMRFIESLASKVEIDGRPADLGASIGIALQIPQSDSSGAALLHAADLAMYRAKSEPHGSLRFYDPEMDEETRAHAQLQARLGEAVASGGIVPHFQPIVALSDNRIEGFEILARWPLDEGRHVSPETFIPMAERSGAISELTWQLLEKSCQEAARWPNRPFLSLNVSPLQVDDERTPDKIMDILTSAGFEPARLVVEVTEGALVRDMEKARAVLGRLQSLGIKIALDDFGTGYAGLYHLRELKCDRLKIDKSFVKEVPKGSENEKIIGAMIGLAHALDIQVIAEGVENDETAILLETYGCQCAQGYHFGAAMPAAAVPQFITDFHRSHLKRELPQNNPTRLVHSI